MPWIWNPLWGNVWVDAPGVKKTAGQGSKTRSRCAGRKKNRCGEPPVAEQKDGHDSVRSQVTEVDVKYDHLKKTVDREEAEPVMSKKSSPGVGGLCDSSLENKFNQVAPGVFKFKHSNTMPISKQTYSPGLNSKLPLNDFGPALPDDLGKYRRVGTASDGTPVFTFT